MKNKFVGWLSENWPIVLILILIFLLVYLFGL